MKKFLCKKFLAAIIFSLFLTNIPMNVHAAENNELYLLAHLIAGEAQDCSDEEQLYVASVALNRVTSSKFPDTLEEVIFQKSQYSCVRDGNFYREPTFDNWENAKWILEHGSVLPEYVLYQGYNAGNIYCKTKYHVYSY